MFWSRRCPHEPGRLLKEGSWLSWQPADLLADDDNGGGLACRPGAEHEEFNKPAYVKLYNVGSLCDHKNMTAGLCEYVFKSTITCTAQSCF